MEIGILWREGDDPEKADDLWVETIQAIVGGGANVIRVNAGFNEATGKCFVQYYYTLPSDEIIHLIEL